ncbi:MAG: DUF11 domain-containing protein [Rhodanobacteraceae bacterium]|nr:DUF11 domain-containing protein [Rhodanobacteraceae bacterium]
MSFRKVCLATLGCLVWQSAQANISGNVFRDYDADGVADAGEPGLGGITVTAYDAAGNSVATATTFDQVCSGAGTPTAACTAANTPALGSYALVIASGGPFRVEFTGEAATTFATAAFGSDNLTSVQFVATSTATVNAGFNNPAQYCAGPTPPAVVAGFFAFGNPTPGLPTLFGFDYDARGTNHDADPNTAGVQAQREYGLTSQTGAIYGIAYQRRTQSLFSASYVHRGSPQGPGENTGTIYRSAGVTRNTTNIAATEFITVNGLAGIDTGANPHPTGTDWNLDATTYGAVGKRGLGDLEISEDGLTLYTINLFQREVLVLPIGTGPTAPGAAQIVRVPVPVPTSCNGATPSAAAPSTDDIRPFATKFFDGTLYIGMVCTAQSMRGAGATLAAAKAAMRGYVYAMNPATNTFSSTPVFEFPLNYPRRFINNGVGTATTDGEWNPWNDTYQSADAIGSANFWLYPQPMLTDIEFDSQGRMAIGLRDRLADQAYDVGDLGPAGDQNDQTRQGGDLLLACRNGAGGSWVLENAGACGTSATSDPNSTGAGSNVGSGPGDREFYWEEYYDFDFSPDFHRETAMGSLLWRPGSGNFMSTVYDVDGTFNAGVRVYRNDNGANARLPGNIRHEFRLYEDGTSTFGKGGGIGDIEILCESPPVELGNRVWRDSNRNGRQDPGEPVFANVVINLYNAAGAQLGSATTNASGDFLFLFTVGATDANPNDNNVILPDPFGTAVTLLVAPANFTAGNPLAGFTATLANTGGALRDSNGVAVTVGGGGPSGTGFATTVGEPGRNDHSIDFGFGIADFGDLPDTGAGSGIGNYSTLSTDNGATHGIVPGLFLGATVDGESNGQPGAAANGDDSNGVPDDEDGVTVADLSLRVAAAANIRVNATNTTGAAAQLCGFVDFNGDGDFADAGEAASAVAVPNGSNNVQFTLAFGSVPAGSAAATYARFRLSDVIAACAPNGPVGSGEVEDYPVGITALDFGDLPDTGAGTSTGNYNTQEADSGANHRIVAGLFMGGSVDAEANGQQGINADGDDVAGAPDDEDGVTVADLQFVTGSTATVRVNATNLTAAAATLCGLVDFNGDGDFGDTNETASVTVNTATNNVQFTLNFGTVPAGVASTYARFRLSSPAAACTPSGSGGDGEVEDYRAGVIPQDLGDLPDPTAGIGSGDYSTLLANNGPRHPRTATAPGLGPTVDTEADGQPNVAASGDGADEDGVTLPALFVGANATVTAVASNPSGVAAQLCGFLDFNGDGDFSDAGETLPATAVAPGTVNGSFPLNFGTVPAGSAATTYARFRISSSTAVCTPVGPAPDGEVEDYVVTIGTLDFGDLPAPLYPTLLAGNGARHPIISGLRMGASVDAEADGQPNAGASGDDTGGTPDDEDGVTVSDLSLVSGSSANVRITATNTSGSAAQLCGFIDFNGDGDFTDSNETAPATAVPNGSTNQQFTLNFGTVPGSVATSTYARFRLSTDTGACNAAGAATNGEVEDYAVSIGLVDLGDLPDTGAGSGNGNYSTLLADNGPRHPVVAGLRLGTNEDGEADGQPSLNANGDDTNGTPDDEDGVTVADLTLTGGTPATVRVNATNTTGNAAQLCGFIDFNGDGDFADPSEAAPAVAVASGSNNLQFTLNFGTVPTNAVSSTYARFRLSTGAAACSAVGIAADGEVEDYPVGIAQVDFGDLPDTGPAVGPGNYSTRLADNGPRHPIVTGLRLGAVEDGEADGQPGSAADGDDTNGTPDDEDGVTVADLVLSRGATATVRVNATNTTGNAAQLCGFIDFNADGDFVDSGETAPAVAVANGSNGAQFSVGFGTVPLTAAASSYARFRLSTDIGGCQPDGAASNGEVEDYTVSIGLLDLGDLPDTAAGSGNGNYSTLLADNGPRHPIVSSLFLGATEDGEADGQPNAAASGDGADEDGVTLADLNLTAGSAATIRVVATNTSGSAAQLCGFVDFNGDGDFADVGEATSAAVVNGSNGVTFPLAFTVPANAVTASYARFRLSTDTGVCSPVGAAPNGEVEDYPVGIAAVDYGDLPDTGAGSSSGNYATLLSDNGARHPIVPGLRLGTNEDAEADGQPNAVAGGDDANGIPDDEDGVTVADLALQRGAAPAIRVTATNTTGSTALLCGFLDYNADGDFADAGEAAQSSVPNGSNAVVFTLNFGAVPSTAAAASYARFRLSTDSTCTAAGAAANGEVEDYPITVGGTFDLALRKTLTAGQPGPFTAGSDVSFDIEVFNQGTVQATTIVVNDYIPAGFALSPTETNWTSVSTTLATRTITGPLAPGASTVVTIRLRIQAGAVSPLVNRAEIGSADDDGNASTPPPLDIDSTPDGNPGNDAGGAPGSAADDAINGNGTGTPGGTDPLTDEDDADPAQITFGTGFDLALRKRLTAGQPGPFLPGQDVTFDITVFNQGTVQATTIVVNDYIPAGFELSPTELNWNPVSPVLATRTIDGPLVPGANTTVTITLRILPGAVSPLVNRAEIGRADDDADSSTPPPLDIDSSPDGNLSNDAGGAPGSGSDDAINGNGTGVPGGTDPLTDEDDADPAQITLGTPGGTSPLGLAKQSQVLAITGGGGYGDGATPGTAQIAYVILVRNYGTQPVDNLQIVENLVTTFGAGTNWNVVSLTSPTLSLNPAYDGRASTNLLAGGDTLAVGATTTLRLVVSVQFAPGAVFTNQVLGTGLVGNVAVSDLSHDGTDPAPGGGNPSDNSTPTGVRLGLQPVPVLSLWSFGLLLLGLAALAWRQRRVRQV